MINIHPLSDFFSLLCLFRVNTHFACEMKNQGSFIIFLSIRPKTFKLQDYKLLQTFKTLSSQHSFFLLKQTFLLVTVTRITVKIIIWN